MNSKIYAILEKSTALSNSTLCTMFIYLVCGIRFNNPLTIELLTEKGMKHPAKIHVTTLIPVATKFVFLSRIEQINKENPVANKSNNNSSHPIIHRLIPKFI